MRRGLRCEVHNLQLVMIDNRAEAAALVGVAPVNHDSGALRAGVRSRAAALRCGCYTALRRLRSSGTHICVRTMTV